MPPQSPATASCPEKAAQHPIEQILDSCLEDIQAGRKQLADCLQEYPSYADELSLLLTIVLEIRAVPSVSPSAAFRRNLRRQLRD